MTDPRGPHVHCPACDTRTALADLARSGGLVLHCAGCDDVLLDRTAEQDGPDPG